MHLDVVLGRPGQIIDLVDGGLDGFERFGVLVEVGVERLGCVLGRGGCLGSEFGGCFGAPGSDT